MDWYEAEVREIERSNGAKLGSTVFYGGSSVRLWSTLSEDFPNCAVVNRGFGGATLAACVHYFDRLVTPVRPGSLVLYAGENDLGDGRSAREVLQSFHELRKKVQERLGETRFSYISIKPSPARWHLTGAIQLVNRRIQDEGGFFIDVFGAMLGPDGMPNPNLYCEDGLHLSPEGYRLWKEILSTERERIFTKCSYPEPRERLL